MSDYLVEIVRPALGGGVGRTPDGRVVFVRHALVGEVVLARETQAGSRFSRADAIAVERAHPGRVAPPCPYAGPAKCGGCDLQHADEATQREWKRAVIDEQLARLAGVSRPVEVVAPPSAAQGSRVRLRCAVDDQGRLGLRRYRSHDVEVLDACWLADERLTPAFSRRWSGAREVELRAIGEGQPFAVVLSGSGGTTTSDLSGRALSGAASQVSVEGLTYRVSPGSFWQSHRDAPALLVEAVTRSARPEPGDRVIDLYGGVGLFAAAMAERVGERGRVVCVESSRVAADDARSNTRGLGVVAVRAAAVSARVVEATVTDGSVVVVDPPRSGLGRGVAEAISGRRPRHVTYVSCDAPTLARDLRKFLEAGFDLVGLDAFDLFPMTEHVELVASLDLNS